MADEEDRASEGSDISVERGEENDIFEDLNAGEVAEVVDPQFRAEMDDFIREIIGGDSDDDDDFAGYQGNWVADNFERRATKDFRRNRSISDQSLLTLGAAPSALKFFSEFWDLSMFQMIVEESNRYAHQQRVLNPPPRSFANFTDFSLAEIKTFLGLCLMMGIIRLPRRSDYWRTKASCWLAHTKFGKAISRDRFNTIWRYLHLQDNEAGNPTQDKLFKIRTFLDKQLDKFKNVFQPGPAFTVDESMVKFKGRLSFRQYLPMKPIKWGVKIWTLAEATTGYVSKLQIYTGRENHQQEHGLSHRVVMDMCAELQGSQAQVYFDNFFSSVRLMKDLKLLNVQACGTIRANRKDLPRDAVPKKGRPALRHHDSKVAQRDGLVFTHWQDTKPVCVLSNFHDPTATGVVRRNVNGRRTDVQVPVCLADYQKYMRGVDVCDQMVGYYMLNHRSLKWWRRIFFHTLLVSVHNAYVVAKAHDARRAKEEWPSFQDFVESVTHELVTPCTVKEARVAEGPSRANLLHDIQKIFQKRKTCKSCARKAAAGQRRRATLYGCVQCDEPCHPECLGDHIRHHNSVRQLDDSDDTTDEERE